MMSAMHNLPHGQAYSPKRGFMPAQEYYASQQFLGRGQEGVPHRPQNQCSPVQDAAGRGMTGAAEPNCQVQRESRAGFDKSSGRVATTLEKEPEA